MQKVLYSFVLILIFTGLNAQEGLVPLNGNINLFYEDLHPEKSPAELASPQSQKPAGSLFIPFQDDFFYANTEQYARTSLWKRDSSTYINTGLGKAPPSLGVATFDGLNKHGYPYRPTLTNLTLSYPSDTLTSNPINLFRTASSQTLFPTDKIGLSFYYQARGYGEPPEQNDSLILDLYKPFQKKWDSRVWYARGSANPNINDSAFYRVFVWLKDTAYLHDDFQFRLRNTATSAGNFDHFHVDYFYLNQGRDSIADTTYNDVTFAYVPTPFLKDYSSMPFQQYDFTEMATKNWVALKNNYTFSLSIYYENRIYKESNGIQQNFYSAQADNIPPFKYYGYFANPAFSNPASQQPNFNYKFPLMTDSTDFKIKHYVYRSGTNTDFIIQNDTVVQPHKFRNYYAYDDGSAEGGYYVKGVNAKMALKFRLNVPDTLRSVRIYFDPAPLGTADKYYFKIKIWSGPNSPGAEVAVIDSLYYPYFYKTGFKNMYDYILPNPLLLKAGTYFIGIQQQVSTGLIVGFDKNYDAKGNLYFNDGSGWEKSAEKGAILLRPVFGAKVPNLMGLSDSAPVIPSYYNVYPNPSMDKFAIRSEKNKQASYHLINELGQIVLEGQIESLDFEIETRSIHSGMYILMVKEKGVPVQQQKIIIQK